MALAILRPSERRMSRFATSRRKLALRMTAISRGRTSIAMPDFGIRIRDGVAGAATTTMLDLSRHLAVPDGPGLPGEPRPGVAMILAGGWRRCSCPSARAADAPASSRHVRRRAFASCIGDRPDVGPEIFGQPRAWPCFAFSTDCHDVHPCHVAMLRASKVGRFHIPARATAPARPSAEGGAGGR